MGEYLCEVRIVGTAPLLQHRFAEGEEPVSAALGKVDYSQEWVKALYLMEDEQIYQPAVHIERAMVKAAVNYKVKGKRGKTYKDLFNATVFVEPDFLPLGMTLDEFRTHLNGANAPARVDARPVRVQRARVMRHRPRFDEWQLDFTIRVLTDQLPKDIVQKVLEDAGRFVGIGDYRPRFGRFRIEQFKVQK